MAKQLCPIETEPRTLNQGQLTLAREVAVDMFHKDESNEASEIFIQGLKPAMEIEPEIVQKAGSRVESAEKSTTREMTSETCFQCSCKSIIVETPEQINLKEPLSAPF